MKQGARLLKYDNISGEEHTGNCAGENRITVQKEVQVVDAWAFFQRFLCY
jgi:hypothetical protein